MINNVVFPTENYSSPPKSHNGLISFSFNPTNGQEGQHCVSSVFLPHFYQHEEIGENYSSDNQSLGYVKINAVLSKFLTREEIAYMNAFWEDPPFNSPTYFIKSRIMNANSSTQHHPSTPQLDIMSHIKAFTAALAKEYHGIALDTFEITNDEHEDWNSCKTPHPLGKKGYMQQMALAQKIMLQDTLDPAKTHPRPPLRKHL